MIQVIPLPFKISLLITEDGRIYRGVNIEVSSYSLTICAERVAIFKAISEGEHKFKTIFIASDSEKITSPCGACRQVLWELAGDIDVVMINKHGEYKISKMNELLPISFDKTYL
ncbi:cytidine deaminase [candidate division KSB1 bacterium 4572_119]|nr:MAG: cytidine deaminase [candidate division KSB1 bacterium 4572_119]